MSGNRTYVGRSLPQRGPVLCNLPQLKMRALGLNGLYVARRATHFGALVPCNTAPYRVPEPVSLTLWYTIQ